MNNQRDVKPRIVLVTRDFKICVFTFKLWTTIRRKMEMSLDILEPDIFAVVSRFQVQLVHFGLLCRRSQIYFNDVIKRSRISYFPPLSDRATDHRSIFEQNVLKSMTKSCPLGIVVMSAHDSGEKEW